MDAEPVVTSAVPFGPTSTSESFVEIKFDLSTESINVQDSLSALNISSSEIAASVAEKYDDDDDDDSNSSVPGNDGLWRLSSLPAVLQHPFNFKSAYSNLNSVEPETTNVTKNFSGTLDYIFFNGDLSVESVSPLLTLNECRTEDGLPNSNWPSDHLMLSSKLGYNS